MNKKSIAVAAITGAALLVGAGALYANRAGHGYGPRGLDRPSFVELDVNKDGKLGRDEMAAFGASKFNEADTNGDGVLSKDELLARAQGKMAARGAQRIDQMMARKDANNDGVLSIDEMRGKFDLSRAFQRMDKNGDGVVSEAEYADLMEHRRGPKHMGQQGQTQRMRISD